MFDTQVVLTLTRAQRPMRCMEIADILKCHHRNLLPTMNRLVDSKIIREKQYPSHNKYFSTCGFPDNERPMAHREVRARIRREYPKHIWFRARTRVDMTYIQWMHVDGLVERRHITYPEYKFKEEQYAD